MTTIEQKNAQRVGFILVPNFALMSYASAAEPLRAANLIAGTNLYDVVPCLSAGSRQEFVRHYCWLRGTRRRRGAMPHDFRLRGRRTAGLDRCGKFLRDVTATGAAGCQDRGHFQRRLCAGSGGIAGKPRFHDSLGACAGAERGLWPSRASTGAVCFRWRPHHLRRRRCPLDMMHAMISQRMGAHFARRVSDWYLHTAVAEPGAPQRGSSAERHGTNHPALLTVLEKWKRPLKARSTGKPWRSWQEPARVTSTGFSQPI